MILRTQTEIVTAAKKIVETDVILCASVLMGAIFSSFDPLEGVSEDDLLTLRNREDHDTPANDFLEDADSDSLIEYLDERSVNLTGKESKKQLLALAEAELEDQGAVEFCENMGLQPHYQEVMEYWAVTKELGKALQAKGESVVIDFLGMNIWGRATSGQSVYMDTVIEDIAKDRG